MRSTEVVSVVGLLAACGLAMAEPTVDGRLAGDESFYGTIKWVNTENPTTFGNNHPSNVPPAGDASTATAGIEICIPLAAIGNPAGAFKLTGWVTSGDHTFMSNQVVGGLPNLGNLGGDPDFSAISGNQFINVTPTTGGATPTIDGQYDASYGAAQDGWAQANFTGFGDAGHGNVDGGSGSEINQVFAWKDGTNLYLYISGNLEANSNAINLLFDTTAGGQNVLDNFNPSFDNPINSGFTDVLNTQAGTTFDAGFECDYFLTIAGNDIDGMPTYRIGAHLAETPLGGGIDDWYLGQGQYANVGGAMTGADVGAPAFLCTIDNSNIAGVAGSPPVTIPDVVNSVGSEFDGVYADLDRASNKLTVLITGNIQTNYNKISLNIDCRPGGQHTMRGPLDSPTNVDISFNGLNRHGHGEVGAPPVEVPGLTFDTGFESDYWMSINAGGLPVFYYADASVLRTDGPTLLPPFPPTTSLDYGCYSGLEADVTLRTPITFSGEPDMRLEPQDGFTTWVYANYAPRTASAALQADNFDPAAGAGGIANLENKINVFIDNSNIDGVDDVSTVGASSVTTGIEFSIDLAELGWVRSSDIKLAAHIANDGFWYVSNQVLGGLPSGSPSLEEVRSIDYSTIAGDQFVVVHCAGDYNADGNTNGIDVGGFLSDYSADQGDGGTRADLNGDGMSNGIDVGLFLQAYARCL